MIVIQICSTSQFAVRVVLYLYIILSASCTVDIIDQVELWTPLYTGYIFTPFVKYFTSERLIIGYMFKLTGLHSFRLFPSGLPYFVFMHAFNQSFHISTCKKKYAHWCKIVTFRAL